MTMIKIRNKTNGFGLPCFEGAPFSICSMEGEGEAAGGGGGAPAAGAGAEEAPAGGEAAAEGAGEGQVTSLAGGAGGEGKPGEGAGDGAGEGEGEAKPGEGEGEKLTVLGAPEAYDLKAPEGMAFDAKAFEVMEPVLRKLDLSGEAAQELVNTYGTEVVPLIVANVQEQIAAKTAEDHAAFRKSLEDASRADPEIGGANFDQTIDLVAQTWERFGIKPNTGIRKLLDETGFGNDPDILRFLSRVGKATGEGSFVTGDGAPSGGRKSDAEIFYPEQATK